jgi:hypothetical protein
MLHSRCTHTHSHTHAHTHTHTPQTFSNFQKKKCTHTHTHTSSFSLSLSRAHTHLLSLFLSLAFAQALDPANFFLGFGSRIFFLRRLWIPPKLRQQWPRCGGCHGNSPLFPAVKPVMWVRVRRKEGLAVEGWMVRGGRELKTGCCGRVA